MLTTWDFFGFSFQLFVSPVKALCSVGILDNLCRTGVGVFRGIFHVLILSCRESCVNNAWPRAAGSPRGAAPILVSVAGSVLSPGAVEGWQHSHSPESLGEGEWSRPRPHLERLNELLRKSDCMCKLYVPCIPTR